MVNMFGKYGYMHEPPDIEECNPENYGEATCYFCVNSDYCKELYEEHISEECDNDCEHCAWIECPREEQND